jgi:hypothetical protein
MSTFESTLKERDKTHAAEMELERRKREKLEALVMTMQHNYDEGQRHVEKGSETVDQPDKQITMQVDAISKYTRPILLDEDTDMQDNPAVDSKWKVRSGKDQDHSSDSDDLRPVAEDNSEFFLDDNGDMNLVVSGLYVKLTTP